MAISCRLHHQVLTLDRNTDFYSCIPRGTDELSDWTGRAADVMHSTINVDQTTLQIASVPMNISISGRTLRTNGRGTDHAWGGNQIIMGGPVNGGHIFGSYPSLALDSIDDIGRGGRLLPTTPVDGFIAETLKWFGVSKQNLCYVLPNFENFCALNSFYQAFSRKL